MKSQVIKNKIELSELRLNELKTEIKVLKKEIKILNSELARAESEEREESKDFIKLTLEEFNNKFGLEIKYTEKNLGNFFDYITEELNDTRDFYFFSSLCQDDVLKDYKEELEGLGYYVEFIELDGVYLVTY